MEEWTIGELARRVGVATSTLRYYESMGLLEPACRVNGRRRYHPDAAQRMAVFQLAQRAGFAIEEMRTLAHGFAPSTPASTRWRTLAQSKLVEVQQRIEQARQMQTLLEHLLECGCLELEDCVRGPQVCSADESFGEP
jgi:MerR family redox-sensitive transcriptional activator SoxR